MHLIAEDLLPLSLVSSRCFKSFVQSLDPQYQLPSRKHLSTILLKKKYSEIRSDVVHRLESTPSINLTMVLWSNRQMRSFVGITGHFVSDAWKMESVMLSCNRVTSRHTAETIFQLYEDATHAFNINEKVLHIITDTASNMKKAFTSLPGYEGNSDDDSDVDSDSEDDLSDLQVQSLKDVTEPDVSDLLPLEGGLNWIGCFAHVLQLIVKDGLRSAGRMETVISKCSKLVSHVRKSTIATDVLAGNNRLQYATSTRWNSQLKMIRSVLSIPEVKLDELEGVPKLTAHDRSILRDIVEILIPFEEATDMVQTENIPSSGYILVCIKSLRHQLKKLASKYHSAFVRALNTSFENRMPPFEACTTFILGAILDPRLVGGSSRSCDECPSSSTDSVIETFAASAFSNLMELCLSSSAAHH